MAFEYKQMGSSMVVQDVRAFSHALYYRGPVNDQHVAHDSVPRTAYVEFIKKLIDNIGPGIEMWNDELIVFKDFGTDPQPEDYHWHVISLVPLIFTFRTKELAIIAKLTLS